MTAPLALDKLSHVEQMLSRIAASESIRDALPYCHAAWLGVKALQEHFAAASAAEKLEKSSSSPARHDACSRCSARDKSTEDLSAAVVLLDEKCKVIQHIFGKSNWITSV